MPVYTLRREQWIPRPVEEVFRFFSNAANLEAITPEFLRFHVVTPETVRIQRGTVLDYRLKWHGLPIRWRTRIVEWDPPHGFVDIQVEGPYQLWQHRHAFETEGAGTRMVDSLEYELPFGILGAAAHSLKVRRDIRSIFDYRRDRIAEIFSTQSQR